jgi:hypothetical protein
LEKINEFKVPTQVNSTSLHPNSSIFVCGGDDFKMYKFDYKTGQEIGKFYYLFSLKSFEILLNSNGSGGCGLKMAFIYVQDSLLFESSVLHE